MLATWTLTFHRHALRRARSPSWREIDGSSARLRSLAFIKPTDRDFERAKQRSARGRLPTIFLAVGFHCSCSTRTAMGPLDSGSRRTTQGWDCHRSRTGRRVRSLGALKVRVQRLLQRISRPSSLKTACGCWPEPFINDLVADHHAFPSPSRAYRLTTLHTFLTGPLAGDASCCGTSAQG